MSVPKAHRLRAEQALRLILQAARSERSSAGSEPEAHSGDDRDREQESGLSEGESQAETQPRSLPVFIYCNLGESSAALAQNFADLGLTEFDGVDARFNAIWRAFELAVRRLGVTRKGSRDERCPSPAP